MIFLVLLGYSERASIPSARPLGHRQARELLLRLLYLR
jgi:hypothetical protein